MIERRLSETIRRFESAEFRAGTGRDKQEELWNAVAAEPYRRLPKIRFSFVASFFRTLRLRYLSQAFDVEADVRPPRTKAFHPWGTVAKVEWVPGGGHPYTGLFATGAPGLARLSLALDDRLYEPSAAFKLLVDGERSEHVLLDQSLDPQTSRDFFERAPTNVSLWPTRPPMLWVWFLIHPWLSIINSPMHQRVDHIAAVKRDGTRVTAPRAPHRLLFYAPGEVHTPPESKEDFRLQLARIPAGTLLFRVFARDTEADQHQVFLGEVRTESEFVASEFGDRVLSLRHARDPER
jgi:hypothetical protein